MHPSNLIIEATGLSWDPVQLVGVYCGPEMVNLRLVSLRWMALLFEELKPEDRGRYYHELCLLGRLEIISSLNLVDLELDLNLIIQTLIADQHQVVHHLLANFIPVQTYNTPLKELLLAAASCGNPKTFNMVISWCRNFASATIRGCDPEIAGQMLTACVARNHPATLIPVLDFVAGPNKSHSTQKLTPELVALAHGSSRLKTIAYILNHDYKYHRARFLRSLSSLVLDFLICNLIVGWAVTLVWTSSRCLVESSSWFRSVISPESHLTLKVLFSSILTGLCSRDGETLVMMILVNILLNYILGLYTT